MSEIITERYKPYDLSDEEIDDFCEANIWPAAEHFWGDNFCDPELIEVRNELEIQHTSGDGMQSIIIGANMGALFEIDDNGESISGTAEDISVDIWFEAYRDDVTEIYQKGRETNLSVWEMIFYEFPIDGLPGVTREYIFKDEEGEDVERLSKSQKNFLRSINKRPDLKLERRKKLNSQDCVDVHNILLALDVPQGAISLTT